MDFSDCDIDSSPSGRRFRRRQRPRADTIRTLGQPAFVEGKIVRHSLRAFFMAWLLGMFADLDGLLVAFPAAASGLLAGEAEFTEQSPDMHGAEAFAPLQRQHLRYAR